jgi:TonB family protein
MTELETPPRQRRGLIVVIGLAALFFILLLLIALNARDDESRRAELPSGELYVVAARMRIRTQPSAKAPVLATQNRGDKVAIVEEQEGWVKVRNSEGIEGWAERNAMERPASYERRMARHNAIRKLPSLDGVVISKSDIYAGPGIFYPVVGQLAPSKKVKVFTRDHEFFAIGHEGSIGYVDVAAVSLSAGAGTPRVDVAAAPETEEEPLPPTGDTPPEVPLPGEPAEEVPAIAEPAPTREVYAVVPDGGQQPIVTKRVAPRYPSNARRAGVDGTVVLRGIVGTDGRIREVEILKDLPYGLGEAARDAVRRWRFRPAEYAGERIAVYYTVTVNYRLEN